ncbi:MAG: hypothetical protein H7249_09360 [Chitinophagaceae bacterium]|nr:hypothetical protein [Oligoflexus sp.]
MKIAVFFGVYEAEKAFASQTLEQMLSILKDHSVHVLIMDDASQSKIGRTLVQKFGGLPHVTFEILRNEVSSGFRGAMDRTLTAYRHLANLDVAFDSIIRLDADLFFNRTDISKIFDPIFLPAKGLVGSAVRFRFRDFVQVLADLLPIGFRRKKIAGTIEHSWELKRTRAVWWADLGFKALRNGFRWTFLTGSFQIMGGSTLAELKARGWLDRRPLEGHGLVFGEDVMTSILVKALNHPLIDLDSIIVDWDCDLAINKYDSDWRTVQAKKLYLVHPLKGDEWSMEMRGILSAIQIKGPDSKVTTPALS